VRGSGLDPMTTELVRLRYAPIHRCRICQTCGSRTRARPGRRVSNGPGRLLRTRPAARAGNGGSAHHRRVHHPPDTLSAAVTEQARTTFEPAELASLFLDITKWRTQKIHVALGTDAADGLESDDGGVTVLAFRHSRSRDRQPPPLSHAAQGESARRWRPAPLSPAAGIGSITR